MCMYMHVYVYMYMYMYMCMHVYMYICTFYIRTFLQKLGCMQKLWKLRGVDTFTDQGAITTATATGTTTATVTSTLVPPAPPEVTKK